ncbi:MAG: TM2 domain-containing protein [Clostridiales bacterium]|nr:TM2 domain-containing protein [Clostridiales bacterium]
MKIGNNKRCPRCDFKMDKSLGVCPGCRLNFSKFNEATNEEGKHALKMGEKDRVIFRLGYPTDVKKWVMVLLCVFLGFTGAHYYYVGRKNMGLFFSLGFVVGILNAGLMLSYSSARVGFWWDIFSILVLAWGVVLLIWIIDIAKIVFNRFKIPVSREN